MCDINFLIPLPFKPDKERFIKRQEFRVEFSGLRSLLHSPGEEEEDEMALNICSNKSSHWQKSGHF